MKGEAKEAWGDHTDDDLENIEGKWDRLVGTTKEKTGEAADVIEEKLRKIASRRSIATGPHGPARAVGLRFP